MDKISVRNWLVKNGINRNDIGWDNNTKTVTIKGEPFLSLNSGAMSIINGVSYSNPVTLSNALKNYFQRQTGQPQNNYSFLDPEAMKAYLAKKKQLLNPAQPQSTIPEQPSIQSTQPATTQGTSAQPPAWETTINNEPGAGPGTEDLTTAMSGEPIKKALENGTIKPVSLEDVVGNQDLSKLSDTQLSDIVTKATLNSQLKTYEDYLKTLSQPSPLTDKVNEILDANQKAALDSLQKAYNTQKAALQSQYGKVNAAYKGELEGIQNAIRQARMRTKADMNARGLFFSGVLSRSLNAVEEKGLSLTAKALAQKTADLNAISAKIATLTSNYALSKDEVINTMIAKKGAEQLKILENNEAEKKKIGLVIAGLNAQLNALNVSQPAREEIQKRLDEQAKAKAKQEQEQEAFNRYITLSKLGMQQEEVKQNWAKINNEIARIGLTQDQMKEKANEFYTNLGEKAREFNATLGFKQDELALDKWYKENTLALRKWAAQNKNSANASGISGIAQMPLDQIISMDPTELVNYVKKIEGFKVAPAKPTMPADTSWMSPDEKAQAIAEYNKEYQDWLKSAKFPPGIEQALKGQEDLANTLLLLDTTSALNKPEDYDTLSDTLYKLAGMVHSKYANIIVDKHIADPLAKIAASIILSTGGNKDIVREMVYNNSGKNGNLEKTFKENGLNLNDAGTRTAFYKLLGIYGGRGTIIRGATP